jgi:ADP-ribosyl-[dinitrogen reductase] hydrolase
MSPTIEDRIAGGIWGLLVGDALGVPYEFYAPHAIPAAELIEFEPPADFRRSHEGTPPGTWSDDGALALCLLASLLEKGTLDPDDLMSRLARWYDAGYMAVDGRVFDVGMQTSSSIAAFKAGRSAVDSGGRDERSNGNGSLMRVLPLALWHRGSDEELVNAACLQSVVTHGHLRSQLCCALYCLWARRTLEDHAEAWADAVRTLRHFLKRSPEASDEFEAHIRPDDEGNISGSGYVVDCLRSAVFVANQATYEETVRAAIRLGHDTDTTACVAGGIAGLRFGTSGIPSRWLEGLRGKHLVEPLIEKMKSSRHERRELRG